LLPISYQLGYILHRKQGVKPWQGYKNVLAAQDNTLMHNTMHGVFSFATLVPNVKKKNCQHLDQTC